MSALAYDFDQHGDLVPPAPPRRVVAERRSPLPAPLASPPRPGDLRLDRGRDALLTPFGKATLADRYLMPGESFQDMFARVACAYADDVAHAQRLYDAMSQLSFMPRPRSSQTAARRAVCRSRAF
jgi:ribonucleoside-diphosphate reductase alpha chain